MHYIILILAFVWFAFLAPPKVVAATLVSLLLIAVVGARTVEAVTGAPARKTDVLRSVGLGFVFCGLCFLALGSMFAAGAGGLPLMLVLAAFLASYILGFMVGLGLEFGAACITAVVTSAVSGLLYFFVKTVL